MLENCLCSSTMVAVYVKPDVARRVATGIRNYHYTRGNQCLVHVALADVERVCR